MNITTDSRLSSAALSYLRECFNFKKETGLSHSKANELLSAIIVNRWLRTNAYPWTIKLSSKPTGVDGEIDGDIAGSRNVEFKSSGSKNGSFQFSPNFNYASHGCIVFTQLLDGVPKKIFCAIGKESIRSIQSMAELDMKRRNFGVKKSDMALVHTTSKSESANRPGKVNGLINLLDVITIDPRNDRVIVIEGAQLEEFLIA